MYRTGFDIEQQFEASGLDYLFVTSQPPTPLSKGSNFNYPLKVKSKKGGLKFQVEFGPEGMKISEDGKLTWKIPDDWAQVETDVAIRISDAAGQQCLHSFKIAVQ